VYLTDRGKMLVQNLKGLVWFKNLPPRNAHIRHHLLVVCSAYVEHELQMRL